MKNISCVHIWKCRKTKTTMRVSVLPFTAFMYKSKLNKILHTLFASSLLFLLGNYNVRKNSIDFYEKCFYILGHLKNNFIPYNQ